MPHHFTFHELILNKARGKSGPLFDFGVKDDIRMMGDASVESQDVHAGKVGVRCATRISCNWAGDAKCARVHGAAVQRWLT